MNAKKFSRTATYSIFLVIVSHSAAKPDVIRVRAGRDATAVKLANDATVLLGKGELEGARRNLDAALKLDPTFWPAFYTRAEVFERQHKWELAVQDASAALRGRSWFQAAAVIRADANRRLGKYNESLKDYDQVITLRAKGNVLPLALNNRAWLRATCHDAAFRNAQEAIQGATRACGLTIWKKAGFIDTLATASAEAGDFDSALRYEQQAIRVGGLPDESMRDLQDHLNMFKQHRPVRDI
jgi:tetratricopeptide (TPR) repeat protein